MFMSAPVLLRMTRIFLRRVSLVLGLVACAASDADEVGPLNVAEAWKASKDPAAELWKKVATGEVTIDQSSDSAFLKSLLTALKIPAESQVLVFSKTSLQKALIGPSHPRALYYSADCYIGWVQGGDLEIIGVDPERGPQFYRITHPFTGKKRPELVADQTCLSCHVGSSLQIQSVYVDKSGYPLAGEDRFVTTYESPLSERWGGWYVTGTHGKELHLGNVITKSTVKGMVHDSAQGANIVSLEKFISTEPYLVGSSDIVALMVLEHQYVMQNTLMETGRAMRRVLARQKPDAPEESWQRVAQKYARQITRQLLFSGEHELQDGGVTGGAAFQEAFRRDRVLSKDGRSLKDFNLRTRLFENRCSYMIYSAAFDALPEPLKKAVYDHLGEVLHGKDGGPDYHHLQAEERMGIFQILLDTKPEIRACLPAMTAQ